MSPILFLESKVNPNASSRQGCYWMWNFIKMYDKHISVKWLQRYESFCLVYTALYSIQVAQDLKQASERKDQYL